MTDNNTENTKAEVKEDVTEIREKIGQTAEEIDKKATENAKYDVERIRNWFERKKNEFKNIELKEDDYLLAISSLLSAGLFLGSRIPRRVSWIVEFLSGGMLAYTSVKLSFNLFKKGPELKNEKKQLQEINTLEQSKS